MHILLVIACFTVACFAFNSLDYLSYLKETKRNFFTFMLYYGAHIVWAIGLLIAAYLLGKGPKN